MTSPIIPAEAVEAAARKRRAIEGYDWDNMHLAADVEAILKQKLRAEARLILVAAVPHMLAPILPLCAEAELHKAWREQMAAAWDECEAAKYEIRLNPESNAWEPVKDNPYRQERAHGNH